MLMPKRFPIVVIALSALAACSRGTPTADRALQRDLDLARGQGLELAPQGSARPTLSADELTPAGNRARTIATRPTTRTRARSAGAAPETKVAESQAPNTATRDTVSAPATARPSPTNAVSPPPPGGYKTMGELIRKAPFPINP